MLLAQLGASVSGYALLTVFRKEQWDRLFPAWTATELRSLLLNSTETGGSILEIE